MSPLCVTNKHAFDCCLNRRGARHLQLAYSRPCQRATGGLQFFRGNVASSPTLRLEVKDPFRSRGTRLFAAYLIGLNVFGLVSVLSFVLLRRFGQDSPLVLIGLLAGIACGVVAGWGFARMMKTAGRKYGPIEPPS
jgi:hypothetical protein